MGNRLNIPVPPKSMVMGLTKKMKYADCWLCPLGYEVGQIGKSAGIKLGSSQVESSEETMVWNDLSRKKF